MDCRRLEIFCKVVELKSFSKAGAAVNLSQPTVSGHILALERELALKLLDRLGREVVPTPAGRLLYRYGQRILKLRDDAYQALDQLKGDLRGRLEIAASTIPGTYILPPHLKAFTDLYPEVSVAIRIGDSQAVADDIEEREVEIGVVGAELPSAKLVFEALAQDELVVIVPRDHPWADRDAVELRELAGQPFLTREQGSGSRMRFEQALKAAAFSPEELTVAAEFETNEAIKQAVAASLGVAVISDRAVENEHRRNMLKALPIRGASLKRTFFVVRRKGVSLSPASEAFLTFLREKVAEPEVAGS